LAGENERRRLFLYLEERFGIPKDVFDGYLLFKGKKSWSLLKHVPQGSPASMLKVARAGLRAFQKIGVYVKPTTRMIQIFGQAATRGKLEVDESQLARLLAGEELSVDLDMEKGYVILTFGANHVLGMGFFIAGRVRSLIPRKELRQAAVMEVYHADKKTAG
jgi:NOL1/NOP2/fmu family ribosome biogenesis protein